MGSFENLNSGGQFGNLKKGTVLIFHYSVLNILY